MRPDCKLQVNAVDESYEVDVSTTLVHKSSEKDQGKESFRGKGCKQTTKIWH